MRPAGNDHIALRADTDHVEGWRDQCGFGWRGGLCRSWRHTLRGVRLRLTFLAIVLP